MFLDERGEPGHSGACVFAHCGGHATIVGTFYGRRAFSSAAMRPRGIVTPPVPMTSTIRYDVDTADAAPCSVQVVTWNWKHEFHEVTLSIDAGGRRTRLARESTAASCAPRRRARCHFSSVRIVLHSEDFQK